MVPPPKEEEKHLLQWVWLPYPDSTIRQNGLHRASEGNRSVQLMNLQGETEITKSGGEYKKDDNGMVNVNS